MPMLLSVTSWTRMLYARILIGLTPASQVLSRRPPTPDWLRMKALLVRDPLTRQSWAHLDSVNKRAAS